MQDGTSPMTGQMLLVNKGGGPATSWLDDTMWVMARAPRDFQSTFRRLMTTKTAACPEFRQMMEAEVAVEVAVKRTPTTASQNQQQMVRALTLDEATTAQGPGMVSGRTTTTGRPDQGDPPRNVGTIPQALPPAPKVNTLIKSLQKLAENQGGVCGCDRRHGNSGENKANGLGNFPGVYGAPRGAVCPCVNNRRTLCPTTPFVH